jgi:hypothetical protein
MKNCGYLAAIQLAQGTAKLPSHSANLIDIEILALAQSDDSDYTGRQSLKGMYNANLLKLALDLTSTDQRGNSSIHDFVHSASRAAWLCHAFKQIHYDGVSLDLSYVPSYNFDLHDPLSSGSPDVLSDPVGG